MIEYTGEAIRALDMDGRMTVCNMSIEAGARAGMIAPDDTTFAYLAGRPHAPTGADWDAAVARWRTLVTDEGATFDRDARDRRDAQLEPMITCGTNPGHGHRRSSQRVPEPARAADPTERARNSRRRCATWGSSRASRCSAVKVDVVFVGSCTNSRHQRSARRGATSCAGATSAPACAMLVVPGAPAIKRAAEAEGLDRVFLDAGAEWREPGCSMCIAMNGDQLAPGQYAVSARATATSRAGRARAVARCSRRHRPRPPRP